MSLASRLSRWAAGEPEFACRLVGQGLILALTQVNFLINPAPDVPIHLATTAVELSGSGPRWGSAGSGATGAAGNWCG